MSLTEVVTARSRLRGCRRRMFVTYVSTDLCSDSCVHTVWAPDRVLVCLEIMSQAVLVTSVKWDYSWKVTHKGFKAWPGRVNTRWGHPRAGRNRELQGVGGLRWMCEKPAAGSPFSDSVWIVIYVGVLSPVVPWNVDMGENYCIVNTNTCGFWEYFSD